MYTKYFFKRVWRYLGLSRIRKSKKNRQQNNQKKQRSTKHTHKTKDRGTRTPLNSVLLKGFGIFGIGWICPNDVICRSICHSFTF